MCQLLRASLSAVTNKLLLHYKLLLNIHSSCVDACAGPMQGAALDVLTDPGPLPAPSLLELDPSTNSESAEPAAKKRKVPRLAASSDLGGAVQTGSPTASAGAAVSSGRQPSSGEMLP